MPAVAITSAASDIFELTESRRRRCAQLVLSTSGAYLLVPVFLEDYSQTYVTQVGEKATSTRKHHP